MKIIWNCIRTGHFKIAWKMVKFKWRWRNYKEKFKVMNKGNEQRRLKAIEELLKEEK